MKSLGRIVLVLGGLMGVLATGYLWRQAVEAKPGVTSASLLPLLADEDVGGFAQALAPDAVAFPRDLGAHNAFQTEWWYYTGNLESAAGREFGFQLTFFRRALRPEADEQLDDQPVSAWRTNQVYLAHFTISDIEADRFYAVERFSRGSLDLAGAQAAPYRVWLEDWVVEATSPGQVRLYARTDQVTLDLTLTETLPPVLHGDGGLSVKGPEPGNASYYYSIVNQEANGSVTVQGEQTAVTGKAWKDHEYSTSALSRGAVGWDWFSLQFDDGTALMFFQIRRDDGTLEPASSGSFIYADGSVLALDRDDWQLEVLDSWTSPTSGAEYPAGWRIRIAELELDLTGSPLMSDQELNVSTVYWEGAARFSGTVGGRLVGGKGYVELTGYAEAMTGQI